MSKRRINKQVPLVQRQEGIGNHELRIIHDVAVLDEDWQFVEVEGHRTFHQVEETYVWNEEHRRHPKQDKGIWTIREGDELELFMQCRRFGAFIRWKIDKHTHKGWGVRYDGTEKLPLGQDFNGNAVKECRFVEGNVGIWHGFPVNYMYSKETIDDHVLRLWSYDLGIITKSEILDVKLHRASSLV